MPATKERRTTRLEKTRKGHETFLIKTDLVIVHELFQKC